MQGTSVVDLELCISNPDLVWGLISKSRASKFNKYKAAAEILKAFMSLSTENMFLCTLIDEAVGFQVKMFKNGLQVGSGIWAIFPDPDLTQANKLVPDPDAQQ